jgi:broad specificity phosphatase PhoE
MNSVLFIRHAETDMAGRFCGYSDPSINTRGYQQIVELISALRGEHIDVLYTSDLQRAVTTAQAISKSFAIPYITKRNLREINFGKWEGLTWQQIEDLDAVYAHQWIERFPELAASGGESFDAFQSRVIDAVSDILSGVEYQRAAVVTHGGVMRVVLQTMCSLDEHEAWKLTTPYCSFFNYPCRMTP